MNLEKLKTKVEVASNVALLLVTIIFLVTLTSSFFSRLAPQNLKTGLQRGQKFADLPQVDYRSSENTLLLVLNTKCDFCRASTPFYQQLIEAQRSRGETTRIISLFPTPNEEAAQYMKQNQMPIEVVGNVDFNDLNLPGTPTIILLDRGGAVKNFWVGKIPEKEEAQVINSLFPEQTSMR
jgi:hypothetical protein